MRPDPTRTANVALKMFLGTFTVDQWVASLGVDSRVLVITSATCSSVIVRGLPVGCCQVTVPFV